MAALCMYIGFTPVSPTTVIYVTHGDLLRGCTLEFEMSDRPNRKRGLAAADKPYSLTNR